MTVETTLMSWFGAAGGVIGVAGALISVGGHRQRLANLEKIQAEHERKLEGMNAVGREVAVVRERVEGINEKVDDLAGQVRLLVENMLTGRHGPLYQAPIRRLPRA